MNVITVSRQYGAGGGEVARRLAEELGWELLDRELLHRAAAVEHVPDAELERLDEKALSMTDRLRLHPPHERYMHGMTEAARQAAARGKVVLVGRGTRQLLGDMPDVFHLHLVAPLDWRVQRMALREGWSMEQARTRCLEVDRSRESFTRYFFGPDALQPEQFDLVANSDRMPLDDIAASVLDLARSEEEKEDAKGAPAVAGRSRVLTMSRQMGAGNSGFALTLGLRLSLRVFDRELLEYEAVRLGVSEAELEQVDEQPPNLWQRLRSGSLHHRYFEALEQLIKELAERGNVLVIGRGGSQFLRDRPGACHVRLVSEMESRVRHVMMDRWLHEEPARQLIDESDARRRRYHESYFGCDWTNPLVYHLTVNSGRLGPEAVVLVAAAAARHWGRG
ncbi:MAG TPA: cytidylate kinase-like family protein [Gemmataceae bacterium]|nr:cytidylate kinase-like family protein [Gemmataceae bacterium]